MGYPSDQSNETSVRLDLNLIITASSVLVFVHGCTRASPASLNHPRGCSGHPRSSRRTVPRHTCFQKPPEQHLSCLLSKLELAQELGQMLFSAGRPRWLSQASTRNTNSGGFWGQHKPFVPLCLDKSPMGLQAGAPKCAASKYSTPSSPSVHTAPRHKTSGAKSVGYNIACSMPISDAGTRSDLTTLGLVIRNG